MKKITAIFVFLILVLPLISGAQTTPEPSDIVVRWGAISQADQGLTLGTDVLGQASPNVFIFGDGFTAINQEIFFSYAQDQVDFFRSHTPYADRFNFFLIWLPSVEDGIDIPTEGVYKDTPLDSFYDGRNIESRLSNQTFIYQAYILQREMGRFPNNFTVIITNSTLGIGGTSDEINISLGSHSYAMTHELGHLICNLSDEYHALGTGGQFQTEVLAQANGEVKGINLYGNNSLPLNVSRESLPWSVLIDQEVPIPTSTEENVYWGEVSYYPKSEFGDSIGAFGISQLLYTPTSGACLMNSPPPDWEDWGFCPICQHAWTVRALQLSPPILSQSPTDLIVVEDLAQDITELSLELQPALAGYSITWYADGFPITALANRESVLVAELGLTTFFDVTVAVEAVVTDISANDFLQYNPYNATDRYYDTLGDNNPTGPVSDYTQQKASWTLRQANTFDLSLRTDNHPVAWQKNINGLLWDRDNQEFPMIVLGAPVITPGVSRYILEVTGYTNLPYTYRLQLSAEWDVMPFLDSSQQALINQSYGMVGSETFSPVGTSRYFIYNIIPKGYLYPLQYLEIAQENKTLRIFPIITDYTEPTPILPTPTPVPPTPTPVPVTVNEVISSLNGNELTVTWLANGKPTEFLIHLWKDKKFFSQKKTDGNISSVVWSVVNPGVYQAYVASSIAGVTPVFTPSNSVTLTEPTPTPTVTSTPAPPTPTATPIPPTSTPTPSDDLIKTYSLAEWQFLGGSMDDSYPRGEFAPVGEDVMQVMVDTGEVSTFLMPETPISGRGVILSVLLRVNSLTAVIHLVGIDAKLNGTLQMATLHDLTDYVDQWNKIEIFIPISLIKEGVMPLIQVTGTADLTLAEFKDLRILEL